MKPVQTWEVQTKGQVKFKFNRNTAPYFVSHLDSMSSHWTDITFTFTFSQFHVLEPMQIVSSPLPSSSLFLSFWLNLLSEPMHVCNPAHVWTLQRLAIWSTFWLSTTFLFLLEPMQIVSVAPAFQFPMDLCSASAIQPISFSFVVSQNSFNSIKFQISNPRFPLLLFTLSHTQTHKLHYRSTSLSGYSATLQCCKSR